MIPEYFIVYVSKDSKTGIYHAVYEKQNGNEILKYRGCGIKVLAACGNRFDPMNLISNFDEVDMASHSIYTYATTGWRLCRICWMDWDSKKDYERLTRLLADDWEAFWKEEVEKQGLTPSS